jgi:hypothetical protein
MSTLVFLARIAAAAALVLWLGGCSDGQSALVPVSGRVLIDGKPLEYGYIRFLPQNARASSANLDLHGRFTLKCVKQGDGVVPGQHSVAILAAEQLRSGKMLWHAPKKYVDYRSSGLVQLITAPTSDVEINISWAGGRPFVEDTDTGAIEPYRPEIHKPKP